jgi:hypothetical protein
MAGFPNIDRSTMPMIQSLKTGGLVCRGCGRFLLFRAGEDTPGVPALPLRRCGSLIVACASPADLALVEAWILARETSEDDDGWRIPGEISSLLL